MGHPTRGITALDYLASRIIRAHQPFPHCKVMVLEKVAIYTSRRNQMETKAVEEAASVGRRLHLGPYKIMFEPMLCPKNIVSREQLCLMSKSDCIAALFVCLFVVFSNVFCDPVKL